MSLSWNEIKARAAEFVKEWEKETSEEAEAKTFWDDFFQVFGLNRRRVASFEVKVTKGYRQNGYIDLLWKGQLLVEHKSSGKDLDMAYQQAIDYFPGLKDYELPKYICVCNFQKFRLIDLDENTEVEFELKDLTNNVQHFAFIAGYIKRTYKDQDPINIDAAYRMGKFHDEMKNSGYIDHPLEVFLIRILFCLFAEDTSIFEKDSFRFLIENKTKEDGSDLGINLAQLFQVLNTPINQRLKTLDEEFSAFPYINGSLFSEALPIASFNRKMRDALLECTALDWSKISPAIFGSLFQSVKNPKERRNLGAHYTSEKNILKLINPLFIDELNEEFKRVKNNKNTLKEFHRKIASLRFLDPACGCGNFLVVSYRELRLLELNILKELHNSGQQITDINSISLVSLEQFYGIEIDEWPARISEVAMWMIDHQMNMLLSEEFGQYFIRLPLAKSAHIHIGNALRMNWDSLLDIDRTVDIHSQRANIIKIAEPAIQYGTVNLYTKEYHIIDKAPEREKSVLRFDFIMGNPPFSGARLMSKAQKDDIISVFKNVKGAGNLDYVCGWYLKAADYILDSNTKVAFVSTNSITQGEQVGILWNELFKYGIKIHFAHRTFRWNNEGRGIAAVHVVIIGFGCSEKDQKKLYIYEDIKGEPLQRTVSNINPYLIEGNDVFITRRNKPISEVPEMNFGNMPLDGGNLLFDDEEKDLFLKKEPNAKKFILPLISAKEYMNNVKRWCLWLVDAKPSEIRKMPEVMKRLKAVREFRLKSIAPSTRKYADTPSLFRDRNRPNSFILIPSTTSENRIYIPMGFFDKNYVANNSCHIIPNANLYHFGVLSSIMHMSWVKYTCGRLKSDIRYSKDLVYNNYPWPISPDEKRVNRIMKLAQNILNIRDLYPGSSLADLYNPLTMPPDLLKAHKELDKEVDLCYRPEPFLTESERIEFLFQLYVLYTKGSKKI